MNSNPAPKRPAPLRGATMLLVDDEETILSSLATFLETRLIGIRVLTAAWGDEALALLGHERVDLIVTDYKMPGMNGLELLDSAKALAPGVPRFLMTAYPDPALESRAALEHDVAMCFIKPFDLDGFVEAVGAFLGLPSFPRREDARARSPFRGPESSETRPGHAPGPRPERTA